LFNFNDNVLVSSSIYDGLGRTIESRKYEDGSNFIASRIEYDGAGRGHKTSNPFRQNETVVWTTQGFDALGRVTSVTTPDYSVVNTSYSGNSVTVTDQAGKRRKSVTDALGRLTDIWEDPQPQNPSGLNYQTTYIYDTLDNLVKVTQGIQQRFFMYDSLKRLIRARNPEQGTLASLNLSDPLTGNSAWSTGYQYDVAGNPTQKTDARGIVATFAYDSLNRNTTID
jgi:YD repeat-containing protein